MPQCALSSCRSQPAVVRTVTSWSSLSASTNHIATGSDPPRPNLGWPMMMRLRIAHLDLHFNICRIRKCAVLPVREHEYGCALPHRAARSRSFNGTGIRNRRAGRNPWASVQSSGAPRLDAGRLRHNLLEQSSSESAMRSRLNLLAASLALPRIVVRRFRSLYKSSRCAAAGFTSPTGNNNPLTPSSIIQSVMPGKRNAL